MRSPTYLCELPSKQQTGQTRTLDRRSVSKRGFNCGINSTERNRIPCQYSIMYLQGQVTAMREPQESYLPSCRGN